MREQKNEASTTKRKTLKTSYLEWQGQVVSTSYSNSLQQVVVIRFEEL